jgi:phosphoribosylanthranilate isomerase
MKRRTECCYGRAGSKPSGVTPDRAGSLPVLAMRKSALWPPKVQVAGVSSLEEALFCRSVGVDAVGLTLELPSGIHDGLTTERAASMVEQLPRDLLVVLITYLDTADAAARLARRITADAVQFHGGISEQQLRLFKRLCPSLKTIGRVTVADADAIGEAERFRPPLWDALILDSLDAETGRVGATGRLHDWSISSRIVEAARVPVILAGGLNPENVAAAIRAVRPHGVDAHTGLEEADGTRSFEKIRAFAQTALAASRGDTRPYL